MKTQKLTIFTLSLLLLTSCGKSGGGNNEPSKRRVNLLETEMNGTYLALLAPINKKLSGHLNGSLTLIREKDDFLADVRLSSGPLSVLHNQNIHMGTRCPDEKDDLNHDGYVDGEEAAKVYKEILIPLDDDISSQRMGGGTFPVTDAYGFYFWSRSTSFEKLMSDLREEDINPTDDITKLPADKSLSLLNRVVVILGIPETSPLPETVLGRGRLSPHQAIPVACGVIRRTTQAPGVIDQDRTGIPVPDGETIGGSSGADDGADFPTTGTTTGTTGNYGDDEDVIITDEDGNN